MKNLEQYLIEADIRQNPAITPEYLASLNRRAEHSARAIEQKYGAQMGSLMRLVHQVQSMQRGKEKQIEDLTKSILENQYGAILGDTVLDVKIPTDQREMKQKMDKEKPEDQDRPTFKEIEDEETKTAIHKRKILNMIAQGEAINSKKMLISDENVEGLTQILGIEDAEKMVQALLTITDICNARDWRIPEEVGAAMIENGNGLSGVSKIEWKPKDSAEPEEETNDDEDEGNEEEESHEGMVPTIIIRGLDQAMLFHEAIKGIYGLINQGGLAHLSDETIQKVFMNTDTAADEVQDLKRAKLTAADLRDFINQFNEIDSIENGREYVWGKMIDASILPDAEFLELVQAIFLSAPLYRTLEPGEAPYSQAEIDIANTVFPGAQAKVKSIIVIIKRELDEWEESMRAHDAEQYSDEDELVYGQEELTRSEEDLSPSEIQDLIDQALDARDFTEVERLSKLLKESLR